MTIITSARRADEGAVVRQLALVQAKRFARHPVYIGGVVLLVVYSVAIFDDAPADPSTLSSAGWGAAFCLGVLGFFVAYRLTRTEDRAIALLPSAPVSAVGRTLALLGACLVPAATALAYLIVRLLGYAVWAPYPGLVEASGGWGVVIAALVDTIVVAAFGGSALGVVTGRWLRFPGAGVLVGLGLVIVVVFFSGGANQGAAARTNWVLQSMATVMPWTSFTITECADQPDGSFSCALVSVRDGSQVGHLLYAVALVGLAVCAAILRDAEGSTRRRWLWVTFGCAAAAVLAATWALLG